MVGIAVAAAVITGSLLVGDSVRGSLRDTALSRLGSIDHVLVAPHDFRAALAAGLANDPALAGRTRRVVAFTLTRGAARQADSEATVPNVTVLGIPPEFAGLYPGTPLPRLDERQVALNASLARDLGARAGDSVLLTLDRDLAVPSDTLFAHRKREETLRSLRLDVAAVVPDTGIGGFRLDAGVGVPRNLFVSRDWLAAELNKAGMANALAVESAPGAEAGNTRLLQAALERVCTPEDYGLRVVERPAYVALQSAGILLRASQVEAARAAAADCRAQAALTSVNLATSISRVLQPGRSIAYTVVAGVEPPADFHFLAGGPALKQGEVWLNQWAAHDLGAQPGEALDVSYLVPSWEGVYRTAHVRLTLAGIVATEGSGADPGLVPDIPGITDANRIDMWHVPFPLEMSRITPRDEEYWRQYRAAPRAFVARETVAAMWRGAGPSGGADSTTSVRLFPPAGTDVTALAAEVTKALPRRLSPQDAGLAWRPVRRLVLAASAGTTDFGQLFLAMSFFLVLAAAGLAGMMMRLLAERRASEAGVLLACGFTEKAAGRIILAEGAALAGIGVLVGTPLGILYGWGILRVLATHWVGAVGTSALWLHVEPASVIVGAVSGLCVGVLSVWWGARMLVRRHVLELLAGWQAMAVAGSTGKADRKAARRPGFAAPVSLAVAAGALAAVSAATGKPAPEEAFFGSGALLLASGLLACRAVLAGALGRQGRALSLGGLALRSAAANRGRSLLAVGLIAAAAFLIVTVAANRRDFSKLDMARRDSGTGGFALRAVSSLPIRYDFGSPEGRRRLGFSREDEAVFQGVEVVPFLMSGGEDISCLNIARPTAPRILGVGPAMRDRGGFRVMPSGPMEPINPWQLLEGPAVGGDVPAFGDADSVMWSLHSANGKVYRVPAGDGKEVPLRFAGVLPGSIFQSELLVSDEQFRRLFPAVTAPRYFLISTPPGREEQVAQALRRNLGDLGLEVRTTRELLNAFIAVQNTYLSTFLALGGLGMLLGTFGLVTVLLRSAFERRREFALMLAAGFRQGQIARLLLLENAGLLIAGLACGVASALLAVAPQIRSSQSQVPWVSVAGVLVAMLAIGLLASAAAARAAVPEGLVEGLRGE